MRYKVVKYVQTQRGSSREVVTSFAERWEADEFARSQLLKDPLRPVREVISDEAKVRYEVEEDTEKPELQLHTVSAPLRTVSKTIGELIAEAIRLSGGKAKLPQIYPVVQHARPKVSEQSIRGDLYHGMDAGKFRRNNDGTYSLGTRGAKWSQTSPAPGGAIVGEKLYLPVELPEQEIENFVVRNYRQVFGDGALFIPKKKLVGTHIKKVTDGLLLDLNDTENPSFWIVEIELGKHDPEHIHSQVFGFLRAFKSERSLRALVKAVYSHLTSGDIGDWGLDYLVPSLLDKSGTEEESYQFVESMLHGKRGVIIVIDSLTSKIKEVVADMADGRPVKVIEFKTFKKAGEFVHVFSQPDLSQGD